MKAVIAIDSFKESLTSLEVGKAVAEGIEAAIPDADITVLPIADGGEGTVTALTKGLGGVLREVTVTGPLGTPVKAVYGIIPGTDTAVIEMSAAAGIALVPPPLRDPMNTTTYGVGELITDAIEKGCKNFIVGIGGSATNDAGIGMLSALGFEFLDENGAPVPFGAQGVEKTVSISDKNVHPKLCECTFHVACDVKNPLCGQNGCSAVFGAQKGADAQMIERMDKALEKFAKLCKTVYPRSDADAKGAGAAGGLGFAFMTFLNVALENGIELVLNCIELEKHVKTADVVITGEGRLDSQTVMGKAPIGVANAAKKYNKPVIAFCGAATPEAVVCNQHGIDAFFPILRSVCTLEQALERDRAYNNVKDTATQVFRLWGISK